MAKKREGTCYRYPESPEATTDEHTSLQRRRHERRLRLQLQNQRGPSTSGAKASRRVERNRDRECVWRPDTLVSH